MDGLSAGLDGLLTTLSVDGSIFESANLLLEYMSMHRLTKAHISQIAELVV